MTAVPATFTFRDLTTLDDFAQVVELERQIWGPGYDDVVPVPILAVTIKRGGILVGAYAGDRLVAFVYSVPGLKHGRAMHWSHMLGVVDEYRKAGLGRALKLEQRTRALAMGLDLIEWTYDPMQAANAHLNFAKLGAIVEEYEENVYGESGSPLHKGNPTDRFVAEWWIRTPRVEARIDGSSSADSAEPTAAVPVNELKGSGRWPECGGVDLSRTDPQLLVRIPVGFTEMLSAAPDLALAWRMETRRIFTTLFARRYQAMEFFLDPPNRRGAYLLRLT